MTHKQSAELTKPGVGSLQDPAACVVAHLTSVFIARLFVVLAVGRNQFDGPPVNIPHAAGRSGSQHRAITALSAVWVALISAPNPECRKICACFWADTYQIHDCPQKAGEPLIVSIQESN